jgi:hypothetical protein
MSELDIREIDYYIKGLPLGVRQNIFRGLQGIGSMTIKCLLEKNEGYPKYKRMGLSDDKILNQIERAKKEFEAVNNIMMENERYPLFKDASDTYRASGEYVELLMKRKEEELIKKFGCTFEEYIPRIYKKKIDEHVKDEG